MISSSEPVGQILPILDYYWTLIRVFSTINTGGSRGSRTTVSSDSESQPLLRFGGA